MVESYYGLIELTLVFGSVIGLAVWELISLKREAKRKIRKNEYVTDSCKRLGKT